jgi:hypothetical protein
MINTGERIAHCGEHEDTKGCSQPIEKRTGSPLRLREEACKGELLLAILS